MKRVGALAAALAMIAAAFAYRAASEDDGTAGGGGSADGALVACVSDLADVCTALADLHGFEVEVVPFTATVDELAAVTDEDDVAFDAWIAPAPVVGMVIDARDRAGLPQVVRPGEVVARSPLVLVAWSDRQEVLEAHCGSALDWSCIGEVADTPWAEVGGESAWGRVKPGHSTPSRSAVGLLVAGQATADRLDRTDFASNDLSDPGFRSWFSVLEQTVDAVRPSTPGEPVELMVRLGPSTYDVAGTTEATAVPLVARSANFRDRLTVSQPSPTTTVDLVVGVVGERDAGRAVAERIASAEATEVFRDAGWRVPDQAPPPALGSVGPLSESDGTTTPGALTALLSLWEEIT